MGAKRKTVTMSATDEVKIVKPIEASEATEKTSDENTGVSSADAATTTEASTEAQSADAAAPAKKIERKLRSRSARYRAVRAQIDKTKKYDVFAAVELLKKLSYTKFDGTVTAHAEVREAGVSFPLTLPHSTGKSLRVAVVDDKVLKDIEAGVIDFDILVSAPQFMPKLAKYAPVLGPKGLMPNPKNGTLIPNPEAQKKKLEGGTTTIKTEKKAPLLHVRIGKTSMESRQLVENIETLEKTIGSKLVSLSIAATMSPGIKVNTETATAKA